jgi:hypothetical protein
MIFPTSAAILGIQIFAPITLRIISRRANARIISRRCLVTNRSARHSMLN